MSAELQRTADLPWPGDISVPYIQEQQLKAKLRSLRAMGIIAPGYKIDHVNGQSVAHVIYLKPMPSPARRRTTIGLTGAAAVSGLAWMVWEARYVLGTTLLVILSLLLLAGAVSLLRPNHRALCPGLHCEGCKG